MTAHIKNIKKLIVDMDPDTRTLLEALRKAIRARNLERTQSGNFHSYEGATFKAIVQRGLALVAREVLASQSPESR